MIDTILGLSLISQIFLVAILIFIFFGAVVVGSFMVDVIIAGVRGTSLFILTVKTRSMLGDGYRMPAWGYTSEWRDSFFSFFKRNWKRTITLKDSDGDVVAVWRGVFRWEIIPRYELVDHSAKEVSSRVDKEDDE